MQVVTHATINLCQPQSERLHILTSNICTSNFRLKICRQLIARSDASEKWFVDIRNWIFLHHSARFKMNYRILLYQCGSGCTLDRIRLYGITVLSSANTFCMQRILYLSCILFIYSSYFIHQISSMRLKLDATDSAKIAIKYLVLN